jgi:arylsulfatase A-like enzyme
VTGTVDCIPSATKGRIVDGAGITSPRHLHVAYRLLLVRRAYPANANVPFKRDTQYFEMLGNCAIYHDGWIDATTPPSPLGDGTAKMHDVVNGYPWELYNIANDCSENNDLAASNPDKLQKLQALFLTEAAKYQAFPVDNTLPARVAVARPSATSGQTRYPLP